MIIPRATSRDAALGAVLRCAWRGRSHSRPAPRGRRLWALTLALGGLTAVLCSTVVRPMTSLSAPVSVPPWVLAVSFGLAEIYVIHVHLRHDSNSVSLNEIPLVLGLYLTSPLGLVLAQVAGAAAALVLHRRQRPVKLVFNLSNFALSAAVTVIVFQAALRGLPGSAPGSWLAATLATSTGCVVGCTMITLAISVSERSSQIRTLPRVLSLSLPATLITTNVALIAVTLVWFDRPAAVLLLLPVGGLFLAYRGYTAERQRHRRIQVLYESSRVFQETADVDEAIPVLLARAREMFRATAAELCLFDGRRGERRLKFLDGTSEEDTLATEMSILALDTPSDAVHGRLVTRGAGSTAAEQRLVTLRGAMVAPLRGETGVAGAIVVANRLPDEGPFDEKDLRLFETFAGQATLAIEKGRLERELKHQAFHDSLTGLANRALFTDRVEHALHRRQHHREALCVLFLDLDDFKVVNDSLGHTAGDELLAAVGRRLQLCLRPFDTAARLGGDEFAILIEDAEGVEYAVRVAERIMVALGVPFLLHGSEVIVGGSIGIAAGGPGHCSAEELLRHADLAMYGAKGRGQSYQVFESSMQREVVRRHELKADLQRALDRDELVVHYQPIVGLRTGHVTGVEALVRWHHPQRGMVLPADFVPLAEETGLVVPIGRWVLQQACRQARVWQDRGPGGKPLKVGVNVSARQLQDARTVDAMLDAIRESTLPPGNLVLEITESGLLSDLDTVAGALQRFRALGVRIAIDDFGTGYSSLGYLRRLPVDIVKIDKTFVAGLATASQDRSLTLAIVRLLEALDIETVVEGIERTEQLAYVQAMGCDQGQGFLFSRPVDAATVDMMWGTALLPDPRLPDGAALC